MSWTPEQLPDLRGKTFAITGGNGGLGLEAAKILSRKNAHVVITARSEQNGQSALAILRSHTPKAAVEFVRLDLTDPQSISAAAKAIMEKCPRLDALINNAGVMQPPLTRTAEGFELQMATNHIGHFRLNAQLLAHLEASGGRIVPVSSIAHKLGSINFDDLMSKKSYDPTGVYSESKLANLMYGLELHRRLVARGSRVKCISCHPGYAATNLQSAGVGMDGGSKVWAWIYGITNKLMAQTAEHGAYPLVLAAAEPSAEAGAYYGPTGIQQLRGPVGKSFVHPKAKDEAVARRLWEVTETMAGPFFAEAKASASN